MYPEAYNTTNYIIFNNDNNDTPTILYYAEVSALPIKDFLVHTGILSCVYWYSFLCVLVFFLVCTGILSCVYWYSFLCVLVFFLVCTGILSCVYWYSFSYYVLRRSARIIPGKVEHPFGVKDQT